MQVSQSAPNNTVIRWLVMRAIKAQTATPGRFTVLGHCGGRKRNIVSLSLNIVVLTVEQVGSTVAELIKGHVWRIVCFRRLLQQHETCIRIKCSFRSAVASHGFVPEGGL